MRVKPMLLSPFENFSSTSVWTVLKLIMILMPPHTEAKDCKGKEEGMMSKHSKMEEDLEKYCRSFEEDRANTSVGLPAEREYCSEEGLDHSQLRILFVLMLMLAYGTFVRTLLRTLKLSIPYTVIMMLSGLAIGFLSRQFCSTFHMYTAIARVPAKVYLFIFLPVLIFESAFSMNPHTFSRAIVQILILAGPGILVATFSTAVVVFYMFPAYDWTFAESVWFASIGSATDPVAVVAILRELGTSEVLGVLIEGESLLNDGVAVLLDDILEEIVLCKIEINLGLYILQKFLQVTVGGPIFGYLMGKIAVLALSYIFNDAVIEVTITLAAAYLTYLIGEDFLGVSGILAVVALGITVGSERTCISPEVEHSMHQFWELLGYIANTALFMIVGIIISETGFAHIGLQDWIYLIYLYLVLNALRFLMILLMYPFLSRFGYGMSWKNMIVMAWGGLRGAVGTCLSLEVYENKELCPETNIGPKFLFQTVGMVFLTLVINGTTTKFLLSLLHLTDISPGRLEDMSNAVTTLRGAQRHAITTLKNDVPLSGTKWAVVEKYTGVSNPYEKKQKRSSRTSRKVFPTDEVEAKSMNSSTKDEDMTVDPVYSSLPAPERRIVMDEARLRALRAFRVSLWRQFEHGLLIERAVLELENAASIAENKPLGLVCTKDLKQYWTISSIDARLLSSFRSSKVCVPSLRTGMEKRINSKLFLGYELCKGFISALTDAIKFLPQIVKHPKVFYKIKRALETERREAVREIGLLHKNYPAVGTAVNTRQAIRMVLNDMRETLSNLKHDGLLDDEERVLVLKQIEMKMKRLWKWPPTLTPDPPEAFLKSVSWISGNDEIYEFILENAVFLSFPLGEAIYQLDDVSSGIYMISSGLVKISYEPRPPGTVLREEGEIPNSELFLEPTFRGKGEDYFSIGTVIGEQGLLTGQRRAATVQCETNVFVYHISESVMKGGLERFQEAPSHLESLLWRAVGMRLAFVVLPEHPKYAAWGTEKIRTFIETARVPLGSGMDEQAGMWIEEHVADILIIQGRVRDAFSNQVFIAPQLIPRSVAKIQLMHTSALPTRILVFGQRRMSTGR